MNNNFFKFYAQADKKKCARLDLFGVIGGGFWEEGFDESSFKNALGDLGENQDLEINLNSPGGSVFAGIAIYNLIKQHKGAVTIRVMGMAASAATLITSAPNAKVIMPTGSMMMVHLPLSSVYGNKNDLRKTADTLESIEESVKQIYSEKTNLESDAIAELMAKETYMTADEAVEKGFADEVDHSMKITNCVENGAVMFNGVAAANNLFASAPKDFLEKLNLSAKKEIKFNNKTEDKMTLEEMKSQYPELCEKLVAEAKAEAQDAAMKMGEEKERNRQKAIEEMSLPGYEDLVMKAKFDSDMTAEQLAVEMVKAEKGKKAKMSAAVAEDAKNLEGLNAAPAPEAEHKMSAEEKQKAEFIAACKQNLGGN